MTTRKERYKKLHEDLAKESKGTIFARRQLNQENSEKLGEEDWDGAQMTGEETNYQAPQASSEEPRISQGHTTGQATLSKRTQVVISARQSQGKWGKPPKANFGGKAKSAKTSHQENSGGAIRCGALSSKSSWCC